MVGYMGDFVYRLENLFKEKVMLLYNSHFFQVSDMYRTSFKDLLEFEKGDHNSSVILDK